MSCTRSGRLLFPSAVCISLSFSGALTFSVFLGKASCWCPARPMVSWVSCSLVSVASASLLCPSGSCGLLQGEVIVGGALYWQGAPFFPSDLREEGLAQRAEQTSLLLGDVFLYRLSSSAGEILLGSLRISRSTWRARGAFSAFGDSLRAIPNLHMSPEDRSQLEC